MTNPDPTVQSTEGFFQALFDMSFTNLITLRFLRVIYMIAVVFTGIGALIFVATSFSQNGGAGILALILVVPAWLLYVVLIRVSLEVIAVLFKISDNTQRMANSLDKG